MIPASWGVLEGHGPNSKAKSRIDGNILLDTGAGMTSIDKAVADILELRPQSEKWQIHGLGGKQFASLYTATLFLQVETTKEIQTTPAGSSVTVGFTLPVHGIADIQNNHEAYKLRPANGLPVIGILGRSFLQFTKLMYDGVSGNVVIEIDESIQHPRPS